MQCHLKQNVTDHFTVVCLVTWPMNASEAGVDLVLIEISLLFLRKFLLIARQHHKHKKRWEVCIRSTLASLSFKGQVTKHTSEKRYILISVFYFKGNDSKRQRMWETNIY